MGNTLRVPRKRPSNDVNGIWAVGVVGGGEVDEVLIPWGGGGIEEERDTVAEYSYYGLDLFPGVGGSRFLDVAFQSHVGGGVKSLRLQGDDDTLPDDSIVVFYLALSGGVTHTGAPSGGTVDATARQAAMAALDAAGAAQGAADAADQRAGGNTTLIENLNTNLQAVRNTHLQQHDVQAGAGIAVDLIDDVDNGPGVRIRNTQTPGDGGGVTSDELENLLPTATQAQAEAPSGTSRIIWTVTRLRQLLTAGPGDRLECGRHRGNQHGPARLDCP